MLLQFLLLSVQLLVVRGWLWHEADFLPIECRVFQSAEQFVNEAGGQHTMRLTISGVCDEAALGLSEAAGGVTGRSMVNAEENEQR